MRMANDKRITITIDRTTWEALNRSFRYLHDHFDVPKIVDKPKLMLSRTDVAEAMRVLDRYTPSKPSDTISMSQNEWNLYNHIILYTCSILPREQAADALLLEDLSDQYYDWEENGFRPFSVP